MKTIFTLINAFKKTLFLLSFCAWGISASSQYCTPSSGFGACALGLNDFWITSVTFTGVGSTFNYTGGGCVTNAPYYENTNYTGDVVAGNTYTFYVTRPGSKYLEYYNVWVDWNDNYVLSDLTPVSERLVTNLVAPAGGATTLSTTVTIPSGISSGVHRMRVRVQYNVTNNNNPCLTTGQAETKDFNLNVVGGCIPPTVVANTSASSVCAGESVTLTGSGATSYVWTGGATDGVPFVPATTKTYTVTGTDNGCSATSTVTVTVNLLPTVSGAATPTAVCVGDSVALSGSGATSYTWSGGITNGEKFLPVGTDTYTVTGTTNGCSNTATVTVPVNPYPVVGANASKTAICVGEKITLTGSGATTYSWTGGVTDGIAFVPAGTITYTVTGTASGCSDKETITITVNPIPAINVGADVIVCPGDSTQLSVSGDPLGSTYAWSPATGLSCTDCDNPEVVPSSSDTYIVIVTDQLGCKGSDTINVTVPAFSVSASNDTTVCFGSTASLEATGGTGYLWVPATGLSDPNIANPTAIMLATTTYTVTVTSGTCSDTAAVAITVLPQIPVPYIYVQGDSLHCTTDPTYTSYQWYDDILPIAGATGSAIYLDHSGNYNVEVGNADGCKTATGINVVLGVENAIHTDPVSLYPNPVNNQLTVYGLPSPVTEVTIYDLLGSVRFQSEIFNLKSELKLDVSSLSAGIYFITVKSEGIAASKRFVKQ